MRYTSQRIPVISGAYASLPCFDNLGVCATATIDFKSLHDFVLRLGDTSESLTHPLSGCDANVDSCSDCYLDEEGDLSGLLELPGVSVDCSNPNSKTITIPNYLVECHELDFIDDPNYQGNWTPFFNGVRMRFDNALRNEPDNFEVAIDSIYSTPNEEFGYFLTLENEYYGYLRLLYENNFNNKPAYAYEIEFSHSYVDTAFENTTDQFGGSLAECGRSFSTLLPFKIKNLNTGKYVKIKHSDEGIWNGISTNVPGWFDDTQEHPGTGDCVWSPGEFLTFERDSVIVGAADEYEPVKTFKLELSYNMNSILDAHPEYCDNILTYDQALTYPPGVCVYAEGVIWKADTQVNPQDGYLPNGWYDENGTNINDNPWFPLYPWDDGDKIIVKPKTWYVDGDYWIADMSILGQTDEVIESDLDEITVVPNPYIVDSKYNDAVIKFYHLPDQCTISIYTITGELVTILNHGPGSIKSSLSWNLKNTYGKDVAPGLYIYKVETESGLTKVNKFAIVR